MTVGWIIVMVVSAMRFGFAMNSPNKTGPGWLWDVFLFLVACVVVAQ